MIFCERIEEAALAFCVSATSDFKFLAEFNEAYKGKSNVKRLAIKPRFVADDSPKTWWGLDSEFRRSWKGGNKKSEAIYNFLQVTSGLTALELYSDREVCNHRDDTNLFTGCLKGLESSFDTLSHLRLVGVGLDPHENHSNHQHHNPLTHEDEHDNHPPTTDFSSFKNLRILSCDLNSIEPLTQQPQIPLPNSLEILQLLFYFNISDRPISENLLEETYLVPLIKSRSLQKQNLHQVVVPSSLIDANGSPINSVELKKAWARRRKWMENQDIFTSGAATLRKLSAGEVGESL